MNEKVLNESVLNEIDATHAALQTQASRAQASRAELIERLTHAIREDGIALPMEGLQLRRSSTPKALGPGLTRPALCVIAQGSKELLLGDSRFHYDPAHYLITTAAMPVASRITTASHEKPYLGLVIKLDPALVTSVMVEAGHPAPNSNSAVTAMNVSALDAELLDAVVRLVRLIATPQEGRILAPLVMREIIYRLLIGEQGGRLRHVAVLGGNTHRIAQAIEWLRQEFDQPLRIEEIAHKLGMSVSGFHHHFKAVTAMSPLQFQKQLRLQEARRLMLGDDLDATSAGFRVGYDDASHFNREYKRLFGAPPMRDVERLQKGVRENAGYDA